MWVRVPPPAQSKSPANKHNYHEQRGLLLGNADCIGTGDEAARRLLLAGNGQQRLGEPGGVAALLAVLSLPRRLRLRRAGRVVFDGRATVR